MTLRLRSKTGAILWLIVAAGFVRGLFWVVAAPVWYPIDEAQHYSYVESLAHGNGIPVVGRDHVSEDVLTVAKDSPTTPYRGLPLLPEPDEESWGAFREQYEAVQTPLYYLAMVPFYWVSRPLGILTSIYMMRVASLLLVLTAVPLTFLLARETFPKFPGVWIAAPALLVTLQGFNGNLSSVNNDVLLVPASIVVLLAVLKARRNLSRRSAVLAGAAMGAALLTKMSALPLFPLVGLALIVLPFKPPRTWGKRIEWGIVFGLVTTLVVSPWLGWNLMKYGSLSGGGALAEVMGAIQPRIPISLDGLQTHWRDGHSGFWQQFLYSLAPTGVQYSKLWGWGVVTASVLASLVFLKRRDFESLRVLAWLASSFAIAFLTFMGLIYLYFGQGTMVGRHLYIALAPLVIVIAAGAIGFSPRWGPALLIVLACAALAREPATARGYLQFIYGAGIIDTNLVPVTDQSYNSAVATELPIDVRPNCPVEVIAIHFADAAPPAVSLVSGSRTTSLPRTSDGSALSLDQNLKLAFFDLPQPLRTPFTIIPPDGAGVTFSQEERDSSVKFSEPMGDPQMRLYCRMAEPDAFRFAQNYDPQHPDWATYEGLRAWPGLWAWGVPGIALVAAITGGYRKRRYIEDDGSKQVSDRDRPGEQEQ